jgi:DNA-binding transcriptional LysR family regulator
MNLRSLEYLVAVVDERHFGRAAARCQVSQPTLSAQLRRFEAELGGPLIVRGPRVELTELGHRVIGPARQILSLADDISWAARDQEGPVTGTVRIGIFPTLAAYLLPHLLAGLEREAPGVSLSVVEEMSGTLLRLLDAGEIDVALLASEVPDGLEAVPVFREEFLLATPADDPLGAEPGPVDPEQLRGTDLILMSEGALPARPGARRVRRVRVGGAPRRPSELGGDAVAACRGRFGAHPDAPDGGQPADGPRSADRAARVRLPASAPGCDAVRAAGGAGASRGAGAHLRAAGSSGRVHRAPGEAVPTEPVSV